MKETAKTPGKADNEKRHAEPPVAGEDGDVYFFNPWDKHFEAEQKPKTHKFEF